MEKVQNLKGILNELGTLEVITFEIMVAKLEHKALPLIMFITSLPFMQPIPLPGISSVFALIIFLQAIGMIFIGKPILTKRIRAITISKDKFKHFQNGANRILGYVEKFIHPRHGNLVHHPINFKIQGVIIAILAFILSLPLPIPSTNFIPGLGIFLICLAILEDDFYLLMVADLISIAMFGLMLTITDKVQSYLMNLF